MSNNTFDGDWFDKLLDDVSDRVEAGDVETGVHTSNNPEIISEAAAATKRLLRGAIRGGYVEDISDVLANRCNVLGRESMGNLLFHQMTDIVQKAIREGNMESLFSRDVEEEP